MEATAVCCVGTNQQQLELLPSVTDPQNLTKYLHSTVQEANE